MRKKSIILISIFILLLIFSFKYLKKQPSEVYLNNGVNFSSKVSGNRFQVLKDGEWQDILIKGVNIGMTRPGKWPGEAGISKEEYSRWFQAIGEMNANAIRTYTIHPPEFYKELKRYNEKHENKVYLFQGVWIDEEPLEETLDAFKLDNMLPFKEEINRIVDVVHGNITLPERPGHASGKYTADVSPYVIGWILGIEWYPYMVDNMNSTRMDKGDYDGNFVYTEGAKPFENWLADIMDHTLTYEMEKYKWQRPVSFTNWVSTDMLKQSYEPLEQEDIASINPNVIKLKNIETGYFASYHVYPYYPDFLNFDPKYTKHIDHRGKANNYAGYLQDLIKAHEIPVLIAEFGIPSSRGMTHVNVHGWNQGFISEEEQGNIVANLFEDIVHEGYLGGIIFTWQDEWFKRTWNTMDFDNPDRRPYWSNAQTCEQQFGLLGFDRYKIKVDGDMKDWKKNKAKPIYTSDKKNTDKIKNVYMDHDERYVYFAIEYKDLTSTSLDTLIFLDTNPEQGNTTNPYNQNILMESGSEFIIQIKDIGDSRVVVDSYYDSYYYQYGKLLNMLPSNPLFENKDNGLYNPIKLALNKEIVIPKTKQKIPFNDYETGLLRHGNGNPDSQDYDSLADYYVNKKENLIEIRIPWLLIGFTDPSTKEIMGDIYVDGLESRKNIDGIKVAIATFDTKKPEFFDSFPRLKDGKIPSNEIYLYTWDEWNEPIVEERLKKSYYILKDKFSKFEK
ncbi:hypothetical protein ACF3M2_20050 [Tissierella carlieri]|uniref:hypothetical protein n=1 Tax=Tissierella carlieri TaxID=689904 RepID=UPI003865BC3B